MPFDPDRPFVTKGTRTKARLVGRVQGPKPLVVVLCEPDEDECDNVFTYPLTGKFNTGNMFARSEHLALDLVNVDPPPDLIAENLAALKRLFGSDYDDREELESMVDSIIDLRNKEKQP